MRADPPNGAVICGQLYVGCVGAHVGRCCGGGGGGSRLGGGGGEAGGVGVGGREVKTGRGI